MFKLVVIWALAALFILNAIVGAIQSNFFRANFTAGSVLVWAAGLSFAGYSIFYKQIDAATASGFGFAVKCAVWFVWLCYLAMLLFVAVSGYVGRARGDEKAVIILGAGLRGKRVTDVLCRRLEVALTIWKNAPDTVLVVTGGQGRREIIPEAVAMCNWLTEHGVPPGQIIVEDKSTSTQENLRYAKQLLQQAGFDTRQPLAIATNAFHCYRARQYAKKEGFTAVTSLPASMTLVSLLPSYMREVLAILYMWVFK